MENKICGDCKHLDRKWDFCRKSGLRWMRKEQMSCNDFAAIQPPTNGDVIRQGGNTELFIYWQKNKCSVCAFDGKDTCSQASCWDGMMDWLNAPACVGKDTDVLAKESEEENE